MKKSTNFTYLISLKTSLNNIFISLNMRKSASKQENIGKLVKTIKNLVFFGKIKYEQVCRPLKYVDKYFLNSPLNNIFKSYCWSKYLLIFDFNKNLHIIGSFSAIFAEYWNSW